MKLLRFSQGKVLVLAFVVILCALVAGWHVAAYSADVTVEEARVDSYSVSFSVSAPIFPFRIVRVSGSSSGGVTLAAIWLFGPDITLYDEGGDGFVDTIEKDGVSWLRGSPSHDEDFVTADKVLSKWKKELRIKERVAEAIAKAKTRTLSMPKF